MNVSDAPARARYITIAFGAGAAFLCFVDRVAIGQAAPLIRRDLDLSAVQMGYVFSAFGLAYALFEIPGGIYCDTKGSRRGLSQIVIAWSLLTIATGWAWNFTSMWTTRFLFGVTEAGCFPGLAGLFRARLPPRERPIAEGIKAASARLGGAVAPYLMVTLYGLFSWKIAFLVFGLAGMMWAAAFYAWFRDTPAEHSASHSHGVPWRIYLASPSLWLLCIQWFCHFYGFYFYTTWLPTYLQEIWQIDARQSAVFAGLPLFAACLGSLAGGWSGSRVPRKILAYTSYAGAAVMMILVTQAHSVETAVFLMSLSAFACELSGPISWTTAMDLGGRNVGAVSGAMNTIGQMGGAVAPAVIGYLAQSGAAGWTSALYTTGLVYAVGFLCWMFLDPVTPLTPSRSDTA